MGRLARDEVLRSQVEAAERLGVSLKRFSGWEPATVYEYDDAGRLISSRPEVEWDDVEQGWMISLERYRREHICPLCGGPKEVCQAPYGTFVYSAGVPIRCHVTTAIRQAQRAGGSREDADALIYPPEIKPWGSPTG